MTHPPIYDLNLTNLTKRQVPKEVKGSARSSIWNFAWDVVGGDLILVGDSKNHSIVARGFVSGEAGERAYRYNANDPLREPKHPHSPWRHEISVTWEPKFEHTPYKDGAPRYTVKQWKAEWAVSDVTDGLSSGITDNSLLNDGDYHRRSPAFEKNVRRLHASLSNAFLLWLKSRHGLDAKQEENRMDLTFVCNHHTYLAELKICYGNGTRFAIREALGQIFEYNFYPPRQAKTSWLIVLDTRPNESDLAYCKVLREKSALPLTLLWRSGDQFVADRDFIA